MSSRSWRLLAALAGILLILAAGVGWWKARPRSESPERYRIALLPAGNQSGDPTLDWTEALIPFALSRQLEGSPRLSLILVSSAAEAVPAGATHRAEAVVTRRGGKAEVRFFIYSLAAQKLAASGLASAPPEAPADLLADSARAFAAALGLAPPARPPAIHRAESAREMAAALRDASTAPAHLEAAVTADPSCGWCWLAFAENAIRTGGPDRARDVLSRGRAHSSSLDPVSLARLDLLDAGLSGNFPQRLAALQRLSMSLPGDAAVQAELADALVAQRQFGPGADAYRRAIGIQPAQAAYWNSLAYGLAHAGRFDEARSAIQRYASLDAASANPLDSEGEIALIAGQFSDAARALTASYEKDKSFNDGAALEKAALAYMLNGDRDAGGALLERFLKERAERGDPWVGITRARYESITGRTAQAETRLASLASERFPLAPVAASLLSLRQAAAGRFTEAVRSAALARSLARNPAQMHFAAFAAAAADPAAAALSDPSIRADARALALTLRSKWPEAVEAWKESLKPPRGGADSAQRELLAYCLVSAGREREAAGLVANSWPLLSREQALLYDFLIYPNLFYVRAEVARAARRNSDAQRYYDLFLQYAGDRPDPLGRIARARQAARL